MNERPGLINVWALPLATWCVLASAAPVQPSISGAKSEYVSRDAKTPRFERYQIAVDIRSNTAPHWRTFESKDRRFSVQFPGRPQRSEQKIRTDIGYIASVRYTLSYDQHITYDLMFNELPKAQIGVADPQKLINAARDSLLFQTGGRITAEKHSMHSAGRARDLEIIDNAGVRYDVRLLFADNRLYQLLVVSQRKGASDPRRFFNSFSINPDIRM